MPPAIPVEQGPRPRRCGPSSLPTGWRWSRRYADLLASDGVVRGLIGPREVPRLWDRHLVNCALLTTALPRDASVADIGSGAGLPGLVVALARPDVRMSLVEPLLRRTTFLDEVVATLGLDNVVVRRDRADALHGQQTFDVVTARAVAPLERLLGWCMPLVEPSGALLAMKGDSAEQEVAEARVTLARLGCADPTIEVAERRDLPPIHRPGWYGLPGPIPPEYRCRLPGVAVAPGPVRAARRVGRGDRSDGPGSGSIRGPTRLRRRSLARVFHRSGPRL